MQFTMHASGSKGNFYTVSSGQNTLAIECGLRVPELRRALDFRVSELCGCLVSHEHKDHSRAAADLARAGIDIYASAGTLDALGLSGARFHQVRAHEQFAIGGPWAVYPFDVVHDAAEPLGFVVMAGDEQLLYVSDTPYLKYRFSGLTVIAIECNHEADALQSGELPVSVKRRIERNHFSLEALLEFFRANDLSRLREVHLLHMSDGHADAARIKAAVQGVVGVPVCVAQKKELD